MTLPRMHNGQHSAQVVFEKKLQDVRQILRADKEADILFLNALFRGITNCEESKSFGEFYTEHPTATRCDSDASKKFLEEWGSCFILEPNGFVVRAGLSFNPKIVNRSIQNFAETYYKNLESEQITELSDKGHEIRNEIVLPNCKKIRHRLTLLTTESVVEEDISAPRNSIECEQKAKTKAVVYAALSCLGGAVAAGSAYVLKDPILGIGAAGLEGLGIYIAGKGSEHLISSKIDRTKKFYHNDRFSLGTLSEIEENNIAFGERKPPILDRLLKTSKIDEELGGFRLTKEWTIEKDLQSILKHPERLVMWNKVRAIMPSKVIVFEETELTVKLGKKTMIVYMADGRKAEFNTISEKESDRKGPTFTPELKLEGALSDFSISIDGHWLKRLLGKVKSPFDSKVIPEC